MSTQLSVWAPGRATVEVDFGARCLAMTPSDDGWWRADPTEVGALRAGTRYQFRLDGGPPLADPRSPWQPDGIEGPSATVDHEAFVWHDRGWRGRPLAAAVIYELHVGTFSPEATFAGVAERLEHLVDLGVDAIELLPVAEFSGDRGWGYDGALLWAPHHSYGGPDELKRLVDAAHRRGLSVVLDVVYNHLGPVGNRLAEYGPYFTDRYKTPWGDAVNYDDAGTDEVRRFVIDNALMWMRDYHVDGLRLDAVHAIYDEQAVHVLEAMSAAVEQLSVQLGRVLWLIAESDRNDPRLVRSREAGGYGLDATWSDDFHHALHTTLTGERAGYYEDFNGLPSLAKALERVYVYTGDYSPSRGRRHGREVGDLPRDRFLGYMQNHDQVGNRAVGERSSALMSEGRLMIAAAIVLCSPFVPMLFQGEEWAASTPWLYFTDHRDPELGRAVAEGRRSEFASFGWNPEEIPDPQDRQSWLRSVLDWSEVGKEPHARLLDWHRRLMALRKQLALGVPHRTTAAYGGAVPEPGFAMTGGWMLVERPSVVVVAGLGPQEWQVALPSGTAELALASSADVVVLEGVVTVPPDTVGVLLRTSSAAGQLS